MDRVFAPVADAGGARTIEARPNTFQITGGAILSPHPNPAPTAGRGALRGIGMRYSPFSPTWEKGARGMRG